MQPVPVQIKARLTAVNKVYHHRHGENATVVASTFERQLRTNVRPTFLDLEVGAEWQRVEHRQCSLCVVEVRPERRQTIPEPEDAERDRRKVVEVSFGGTVCHDGDIAFVPHLVVSPAEERNMAAPASNQFTPVGPFWLRAPNGATKVVVTFLPE